MGRILDRYLAKTAQKEWLTTQEAADWLQISVQTVRRMAARGELNARRFGRQFRFFRAELIKNKEVGNDAN